MKTSLNEIKDKITKELKPKSIEVIDKSFLHKKHKSFDEDKLHLKLIIESPKLKKLNSIQANRIIFAILKDELKTKIHALQIEIK